MQTITAIILWDDLNLKEVDLINKGSVSKSRRKSTAKYSKGLGNR